MSILSGKFLNIRTKIEQILPAQPCVLCGSMSRDGLWCAACDAALPYLDAPHCPVCALPTPSGEVCGHCLTHPPLFTRTTAVFGYAFPLDKLIQAMKYGEQLALAHAFAKKLLPRIDKAICRIASSPMPLHPAKLRERGFNQSLLLAANSRARTETRAAARCLPARARHAAAIRLAVEGAQEKRAQCLSLRYGSDRQTGCPGG